MFRVPVPLPWYGSYDFGVLTFVCRGECCRRVFRLSLRYSHEASIPCGHSPLLSVILALIYQAIKLLGRRGPMNSPHSGRQIEQHSCIRQLELHRRENPL